MRAVVQRVSQASVTIAGEVVGEIGAGLMVLLGVAQEDMLEDAASLAEKICEMRIFADDEGKLNRGLIETGGAMLVVSQFTLLGDCRKGRRPGFIAAAPPELAEALYLRFVELVRHRGIRTEIGKFRQEMQVALVNEGPITLLLDSRKLF